MFNKRGLTGLLLLVLVVLAVLLLTVAFHAARSQTEASSQTASSRWPEGAAMPPQRIHFQVAGEGALAEAHRMQQQGRRPTPPTLPAQRGAMAVLEGFASSAP